MATEIDKLITRLKAVRIVVLCDEAERPQWCHERWCQCLTPEAYLKQEGEFRAHQLLLRYPKSPERMEEILPILKRRPPWQVLLLYPESKKQEAKSVTLKYHFYGAYPCPADEEQALKIVASALPGIWERLQEERRTQRYKRIVEGAPPQISVRDGLPLYANRAARQFFDIEDLESFARSRWPLLNQQLPKEGEVYIEYEKNPLLIAAGLKFEERVYTFIPLEKKRSESGKFLSRIELIDRFKDKMAQRVASETPLVVLLIHLENLRLVAQSMGWLEVQTILKEFALLFAEDFPESEGFGIWNDEVSVALFEGKNIEDLKKRIRRFTETLKVAKFDDNISLSVFLMLIEVETESLNAVVNLISNAAENHLTVKDTKGFKFFRSGTADRMTGSEKDALRQFLINIMANGLPLKLLNIYKGLPISTSAKLLKLDEEEIVVKTERLQKFVMREAKRVILQSPHLPGDVETDVQTVDPKRPLAILKNPRLLHTSVNNRKHTRVAVTSRLPVLIKEGKRSYTGYMIDLSIHAVAVKFPSGKFDENGLKGHNVVIAFRLPWDNEEGYVNIEVAGSILFNREEEDYHKVVVILDPDEMHESYIFDYVYKRQRELIEELKRRVS